MSNAVPPYDAGSPDLKPEQRARRRIDYMLEQSGWTVLSMDELNIHATQGVAVREFRTTTGPVDYGLYVEGKVIGTVEAKPEDSTLIGVEEQSSRYGYGVAEPIPAYGSPLPFAYESTGIETRFTNRLDPEPRSREVFTFHRPDELLRLALLGAEGQLRAKLRAMPPLNVGKLWPVQSETILNLERSLAADRPRSLIQMATGSGKTFTACSFAYRLIKFAGAKRILFLVDRNNLGKQALNEFQQYGSPYTPYTFTEEYAVQRLQRNAIDPASKVVITTIQRLYSILKGEEDFEEENEEESLFEAESPLAHEPLPVVYNPAVPIETFDVVVVDECHRSIYNIWRQVLEYFDASLIGLTATPSKQTIGFFNENLVQDYSHERAVADGVNVGYDVYRIETQVTKEGATLARQPGFFVPHRDRRTRSRRLAELESDHTYTAGQLDRDVVNPSQIRTVIRAFRDALPEIFPDRTEVPKTLVFAKTDLHAEDIVKTIREEFGRGNDFCQKITSKSTGKKPEDLLSDFRNSFNPRIAVTVDMIATGTDVKSLECLLFMRNISSASYFEQMKGRGVRVIGNADLQLVTPDADVKSRFVIVDAVGVCENDKTSSKPLDRKPSVPMKEVLALVAKGVVHADVVSTLAARLARLERRLTPDEEEEIAAKANGMRVSEMVTRLLESIDPDVNAARAAETLGLAPDAEPTEAQLDAIETESMAAALRPFHDPKLRELILTIQVSHEQIVDEVNRDALLSAGFDEAARERARSTLSDFRTFLEENRDEIEAIGILYRTPYRAGLRYRQVKDLAAAIARPPLSIPHPERNLWRLYEAVEPENVRGAGGGALVDLVAIVRHALYPDTPLVPLAATVAERYAAWLAEQEAVGAHFTPEQRRWLDAIRDHIAASLRIEKDDFGTAPFVQMGGLGKVFALFGERLEKMIEDLNERLAA